MKITLACAAGMSTSMLVKKMIEAAKAKGLEAEIAAYAVSELDEVAPSSDIILLGPQVAYKENEVKAAYPDKTVQVINMMDYGMMNGEKVLEQVLQTLAQ